MHGVVRSVAIPLLLVFVNGEGLSPATLAHEWRCIDHLHWQIVSDPATHELTEVTDAVEQSSGACHALPGMVEVRGAMKQRASTHGSVSIEELQKRACTKWISQEFDRCDEYDAVLWRDLIAPLPTKSMHFCMDRFEYPNVRGAYPIIFVTYREAVGICSKHGKRLCTEDEWTFACEGEAVWPYPYGFTRDDTACVIDRTNPAFDASRLVPRDGQRAATELDRLWRGEASGSRSRCRSPFGVYDLTGNVDEWTRSIVAGERPSILKGGYWGPIRARCRPSTRAHGEEYAFYQQGVRCCADVPK